TQPRGDTLHALVNAIVGFSKTPLFDMAALSAELTYSRLLKVRSNKESFNSVDYACQDANGAPSRDKWVGCATRDAYGLAVSFVPSWDQVFAGVDLSLPMFYSAGVKGNSPVLFGGYQ